MSVFITLKSCFNIQDLNFEQKWHRKRFRSAQSTACIKKLQISKLSFRPPPFYLFCLFSVSGRALSHEEALQVKLCFFLAHCEDFSKPLKWCEALSSISSWRSRNAKSALPTQKSTFSFFFRLLKCRIPRSGGSGKLYASLLNILVLLKCPHVFEKLKNRLNRWSPKILFCDEKFMVGANGFYFRFRRLELNFEGIGTRVGLIVQNKINWTDPLVSEKIAS